MDIFEKLDTMFKYWLNLISAQHLKDEGETNLCE